MESEYLNSSHELGKNLLQMICLLIPNLFEKEDFSWLNWNCDNALDQ